jgi:hypothetical protein
MALKEISDLMVIGLKNSLGIGYDILINGIGVVSIVLLFVCFQMKNRSKILKFNIFAAIGWTTFFLLNGDFTSALMNIIGICRILVFLQRGKHEWAKSKAWLYIFLVISLLGSILTFKIWKDAFSLVAGILGTIGFYVLDEKLLRKINLITFPFWMANNLTKGFYIAFISDSGAFISLILAMFRYKENKENPSDTKSLETVSKEQN